MSFNVLDKHVHKTYDWLYDIDDNMGYDNLRYALAALRAVLHQLRDNLPLNESVYLSAQLPVFVRGLYFENWNPNIIPLKERTQEEFIYSVQSNLAMHPSIDPQEAVSAVFDTLSSKLDPNEVSKICKVLPKGVREIFDQFGYIVM